MKYFITGGSGFIGSYLIKSIINSGDEVTVLVRKNSSLTLSHPRIRVVTGDVTIKNSFVDALDGVDCIIHLAGVVTDWARPELYENVHVQGTRNLMEVGLENNIEHVIHISTCDVLKKEKGKKNLLGRNTEYTNSTVPYSKTKMQGEKIALSFIEKGLRVNVIRPVWVYGTGDKTLFSEIAYQLKRRQMVFIGSPYNLIPLVHVQNLVDFIITMSKQEKVVGCKVLISDGDITWKQLVDQIASTAELKSTNFTIPFNLANIAGFCSEKIFSALQLRSRPLLTRTAVEMLGYSLAIDANEKNLIPYNPSISLQEGLNTATLWIKNNLDALEDLRK